MPRCVECHRLAPGKDVLHRGHYDHGSVLTIDVMLSDPAKDFSGGRFQTVEADGSVRTHPFNQCGDALVFVSHKVRARLWGAWLGVWQDLGSDSRLWPAFASYSLRLRPAHAMHHIARVLHRLSALR